MLDRIVEIVCEYQATVQEAADLFRAPADLNNLLNWRQAQLPRTGFLIQRRLFRTNFTA
jgi:hypothetical protein